MLRFIDRKFRLPRIWSNHELAKFSALFKGSVINVSGWNDLDKEGKRYRDYFFNAESYAISNFKQEMRGLCGLENEFFLDLTWSLQTDLIGKYDVVFNHTTLEHIYDFKKAFNNLCSLSKDIVIIVVPFMQQMHAEYGDYWRFTPLTVKRMFEENGLFVLYSSFNTGLNSSVYLFFIASKKPNIWKSSIFNNFSYQQRSSFLDNFENYTGCRVVSNSIIYNIYHYLIRKLRFYFKCINKGL